MQQAETPSTSGLASNRMLLLASFLPVASFLEEILPYSHRTLLYCNCYISITKQIHITENSSHFSHFYGFQLFSTSTLTSLINVHASLVHSYVLKTALKNGVINIQAEAYNGAHTLLFFVPENTNKETSKVGYFSKIEDNSEIWLTNPLLYLLFAYHTIHPSVCNLDKS